MNNRNRGGREVRLEGEAAYVDHDSDGPEVTYRTRPDGTLERIKVAGGKRKDQGTARSTFRTARGGSL